MSFKIVLLLAIVSFAVSRCRPALKSDKCFFLVRPFVNFQPILQCVTVKNRLHMARSKGHRRWNTHLWLLLLLSGDVELNPGPATSARVSDTSCDPSDSRQNLIAGRRRNECPTSLTSLSPAPDSQAGADPLLEAETTITLTPSRCPRCDLINKRKRMIECASCNRHWHLSCVRLSRAQADTLGSWDCPECAGGMVYTPSSSRSDSQPSQISSSNYVGEVDEVDAINLAATLASLRCTRPVIRRVPRGARPVVADALTTVMKKALSVNTVSTWILFLLFPYAALSFHRNTETADDSTLTAKIKRQTSLFMELSETTTVTDLLGMLSSKAELCDYRENKFSVGFRAAKSQNKATSSRVVTPHERRSGSMTARMERLKKTVSLKLTDGDVRGAIRLLSSPNEVARDSLDVTAKLQSKHPPAPASIQMPPSPDASTEPWTATDADVLAAVATFNTGSAGGLDGLRPAHLKDLTSRSSGEAGARLVYQLTSLVNLAIQGKIPSKVRAAFYAASLTALEKPDGGIRPIAIGSTYRTLATKVALRPLSGELGTQLRPVQLGYGTPGGCEAAAHATRYFADSLHKDYVILKIDMRNAFNSVRRDSFLRQVREHAPSLYPLMWQAYSEPSPLYHGTSEIESDTGIQQGDPAGPAVFSLAIQPIVSTITTDLNVWFLDDGTLGGQVDDVCANLERVIPSMAEIGLSVNPNKCEIMAPAGKVGDASTAKIQQLLPGASVLSESYRCVLGAPLSEAAAVRVLEHKKEDLKRMIDRLRYMDAHTSLFLLQKSIWLPRLQYIVRAAPIYTQKDILAEIDNILRLAVTDLLNIRFEESNWEQAVLPTRLGGLGLRKTTDIALPSFISSLHRCRLILSSMMPRSFSDPVSAEIEKALSEWCNLSGGKEIPNEEATYLQRSWDYPLAECKRDSLLKNANQFGRARLLGAATSESGAWLRALPSASLGTHLDSHTVRVAVALRVGADVTSQYRCRCGSLSDRKGYHALTCRFSAGRIPRHTALNDIVRRALKSAGVPTLLEPQGIDRGDGKRPDGISLYPFSQGRSLVWDATCVNSFASSHVVAASVEAGAAAKAAEKAKRLKYNALADRFYFAPVAFETSGACGPSTRSLLKDLAARITSVTGDRREMEWLLQRCSIAVVRGNAASVLLGAAAEDTGKTLAEEIMDESPEGQCERTVWRDRKTEINCRQTQDSKITKLYLRKDHQPLQQFNPTSSAASRSGIATGLENLGNTCYMNAVIQVLAHTPDLVSHLSDKSPRNENSQIAGHSKLVQEVAQLLEVISSGKLRLTSPHRLRAELNVRGMELSNSHMHDAHEFLIRLFELLHDLGTPMDVSPPAPCCNDSTSSEAVEVVWRRFQQDKSSIISRLFYGLQRSTLYCAACGYKSFKTETFSVLSLPLVLKEEHSSLYHCLEQYTHGDTVTDWTCSSCCETNEAHTGLESWHLPPVIIFHLKRFRFSGITTQKIDTRVSFPLQDLDLSQLAADPCSGPRSMIYDLYGVVEHHGSHHSGHYTAYCLNQPAGRWLFTNDSNVQECTAAKVKDATAYILFYVKSASAVAGSHVEKTNLLATHGRPFQEPARSSLDMSRLDNPEEVSPHQPELTTPQPPEHSSLQQLQRWRQQPDAQQEATYELAIQAQPGPATHLESAGWPELKPEIPGDASELTPFFSSVSPGTGPPSAAAEPVLAVDTEQVDADPGLFISQFRRLIASEPARLPCPSDRWVAATFCGLTPEPRGQLQHRSPGNTKPGYHEVNLTISATGTREPADCELSSVAVQTALARPRPNTFTVLQGFFWAMTSQGEGEDRQYAQLHHMERQAEAWRDRVTPLQPLAVFTAQVKRTPVLATDLLSRTAARCVIPRNTMMAVLHIAATVPTSGAASSLEGTVRYNQAAEQQHSPLLGDIRARRASDLHLMVQVCMPAKLVQQTPPLTTVSFSPPPRSTNKSTCTDPICVQESTPRRRTTRSSRRSIRADLSSNYAASRPAWRSRRQPRPPGRPEGARSPVYPRQDDPDSSASAAEQPVSGHRHLF